MLALLACYANSLQAEPLRWSRSRLFKLSRAGTGRGDSEAIRGEIVTMGGETCQICRRQATEWLLKLTVEDPAGYAETAFICANCGVKLRLASEKMRDLQVDPWVHDAVATVLRGRQ
jgi:hypothetical protein